MLTSAISRSRGVTLVELMIAVVIIGILVSLAFPSFRTWLINVQIRTAAEAINNGLQLARGEAVRRNTNIQFVLTGAATAWSVGCETAVADLDGDGQDDCPAVIQSRAAGDGSAAASLAVTPAGATMVTFNGYGRVRSNNDGSNAITQLDVSSTQITTGLRNLRILVSGGSVKFCDPNITTVGDPRAC